MLSIPKDDLAMSYSPPGALKSILDKISYGIQSLARNHQKLRRVMLELQTLFWLVSSRHDPPPKMAKYHMIKSYVRRFKLRVIVETGTYLGDFVDFMAGSVDEIYSIEISRKLYEAATKRFKKSSKVHLISGDSSKLLQKVISTIEKPALFWLDSHFSSGITEGDQDRPPLMNELFVILRHSLEHGMDHVVVIDDARKFGADRAYPSIPEVKKLVQSIRPELVVDVRADMIHIHAPNMPF